MIIAAEVIVTPDLPTIRFREPREQVDLDKELPKILHSQGWGCGTYFHVQFVSHDKTTLLASAQYVVSQVSESIHTSEANPYQPITKTIFSRKAELIGKWWYSDIPGLSHPQENTIKMRVPNPENIVDPPQIKTTVTWNPGLKKHQVKIGDKVIYETPDKDLANQVASGKVPIPQAA